MPQFRVGDRVKCVNAGGIPRLTEGNHYTVTRTTRDMVSIDERAPSLFNNRFELVAPPVPVQRPGTVFYSVVFRADPAAILQVKGFETEASFDDFVRRCPAYGYEIICKKKLTLTLPNQEV